MYKLIRLSALSGKDTTYALSGSDFLYATVGTDTAGPSLSSIKLTVDELGSYFGDTLWVVFKQLILHRYNHWKRGDGWVD